MMIMLEEVKRYARIDTDEDDPLLEGFIVAAEQYLKNATGKDYPETDGDGNKPNYELEKVYLQLLIAYWYEHRDPTGKIANAAGAIGEDFTFMTRSLMLQLQNK